MFKESLSQLRLHARVCTAADVHIGERKASVLHHCYLHVDTRRDACVLLPLIVVFIPVTMLNCCLEHVLQKEGS